MKIAIATTLINAGDIIESFVSYHKHIGFDHIYLFFDDPEDKTIEKIRDYPNVTITRNDEYLREAWKKTKLYNLRQDLHKYIMSEPMARQMLNMSVACQMAFDAGIDWILHIDIDELFYMPTNELARDHFHTLAMNNVSFANYVNYEGVPEQFHIGDFFKEVTLFKRNPAHYSLVQKFFYRSYHTPFNYYKIGKAAAQVNKIDVPLLHYIIPVKEKKGLRFAFFLAKTRASKIVSKVKTSSSIKSPIILHYPVCGYKHFTNKYATLGDFENKYFFGQHDVLPFDRQSRDVFKGRDEEKMQSLFRKHIMMDQKTICDALKAKTLIRIEEPAGILKSIFSNNRTYSKEKDHDKN